MEWNKFNIHLSRLRNFCMLGNLHRVLIDFVKLIGEQIRTIRKAKGLTQAELGEKAGLLQPYIAGVEGGERIYL